MHEQQIHEAELGCAEYSVDRREEAAGHRMLRQARRTEIVL